MTRLGEDKDLERPRGIIGYLPDLEDELLAFQREGYPERREDWIMPRWHWMFLDSARRLGCDPLVWLFRNKNGIVAQQGAIAVQLHVRGTTFTTGWFVETMALEAVRGKAVGPMLVKKALEDLPFNISLGQSAQMRELQFALGWQQVTELNTSVFAVDTNRVLRGSLSNRAVRSLAAAALQIMQKIRHYRGRVRRNWTPEVDFTDRFDDEHDRLWERVRDGYACAVVRDSSYLNWKYVDQPGQRFLRLSVRRDNDLVGTVVLMVRSPGEVDDDYQYRRGFIVDLVAPLDQPDVLWTLLDEARKALVKEDVASITIHFISDALKRTTDRFGFLRREATRFLLVAAEGQEADITETVFSPDGWFVTMGDSDIDRPW